MRAFSGILASAAIAGTLALGAAPAQAAPTTVPDNSGTSPGVTDSGVLPSTGSGMLDSSTDILESGLDTVLDLVTGLTGSAGS
ncbi:hypothetical protein [Nocardia sp. NPDC019395]|uniref:hypothetical protein n=1 Tax=Nocardia sp. NPDC019395 TaxID=3154686 RepID=UPI0033FBAE93